MCYLLQTHHDRKRCEYIKNSCLRACGWISSVGVAQNQEKTWRRPELERGREGGGINRAVSEGERGWLAAEEERESELFELPVAVRIFSPSSPSALLRLRTTRTDSHTRRGSSRWTYLRATGVRSSAEDKTHAQEPYMEQTLSLNSVSRSTLLDDDALTCLLCLVSLLHPGAVCGYCCRLRTSHSGWLVRSVTGMFWPVPEERTCALRFLYGTNVLRYLYQGACWLNRIWQEHLKWGSE